MAKPMITDESEIFVDMEMIRADMASEFLAACYDHLTDVDAALVRLRSGNANVEHAILDIKRNIHSLKGMGTTFGFSSISLLAHALEDYFETFFQHDHNGYFDIQLYVDRIREVADSAKNKPDSWVIECINHLPLRARQRSVQSENRQVSFLLLMPKGIQRKIVASELAHFGLNVIIAETSLDAISKAIQLNPSVIMSTMVTDNLTGIELANVFKAIKGTRSCPFLLVTSDDIDEHTKGELPENVTILRKGMGFSIGLMKFLSAQGFSSVRTQS